MIKNVVFDIGKVLIGFDWDEFVLTLFEDKSTADAVSAALWETGYWHELDRAVFSEEEILEMFYSAAPDLKEEILYAYNSVGKCVARRDWAIPLIDKIRENGFNVYFLSNLSEHVLFSNPEAFDFTEHMNGGIFSCYVKTIKPGKDIYCRLFEKYDLVPEECIFIDDHEENIQTGESLGMPGIVFTGKEQMLDDLSSRLGISLN